MKDVVKSAQVSALTQVSVVLETLSDKELERLIAALQRHLDRRRKIKIEASS